MSSCFALLGVGGGGVVWSFVISSTAVGAITGALLGPLLRRVLGGRLGHVPIYQLLLMGLVAGFGWGAVTGVGGVWTLAALDMLPMSYFSTWNFSLVAGAIAGVAGAIQFGWFWLPYTIRSGRQKSRWPLLLAAGLLAFGLGWASLFSVAGLLAVTGMM